MSTKFSPGTASLTSRWLEGHVSGRHHAGQRAAAGLRLEAEQAGDHSVLVGIGNSIPAPPCVLRLTCVDAVVPAPSMVVSVATVLTPPPIGFVGTGAELALGGVVGVGRSAGLFGKETGQASQAAAEVESTVVLELAAFTERDP